LLAVVVVMLMVAILTVEAASAVVVMVMDQLVLQTPEVVEEEIAVAPEMAVLVLLSLDTLYKN
jgi:hypothetical protein